MVKLTDHAQHDPLGLLGRKTSTQIKPVTSHRSTSHRSTSHLSTRKCAARHQSARHQAINYCQPGIQAPGNQSPVIRYQVSITWYPSPVIQALVIMRNYHTINTSHRATRHQSLGTSHQTAAIGFEHQVANYTKGILCNHYQLSLRILQHFKDYRYVPL